MPTYSYVCKSCGYRFDAVQSFSDAALTQCPECADPLRKEYGSIGVTFHGSGFYRTDSRAGAEKAASPASASPSNSTGSGAASGSSGGSTSSSSSGNASPGASS